MNNLKYRTRFLGMSVLILVLVGVMACTPVAEVTSPESPPLHSPPPERSPNIQGVSARIIMEDGSLTNDVSFSITRPAFFPYEDWIGNIIYYLDVEPPDTPGQPATTAEGTYRVTFDTFIIWEDLSADTHTFSAQLVTSSLAPLEPHMHAGIELKVPPTGASQPVINSLSVEPLCGPGYTPSGMSISPPPDRRECADINMIVDILNFQVVAEKIGKQAAAGEGHFIYYFNVDPPMNPGEPAITAEGTYVISSDSIISWLGVVPGEYNVWVQLVNNDNTPLEPPVIAGATVIVPIDAGRYIGY